MFQIEFDSQKPVDWKMKYYINTILDLGQVEYFWYTSYCSYDPLLYNDLNFCCLPEILYYNISNDIFAIRLSEIFNTNSNF